MTIRNVQTSPKRSFLYFLMDCNDLNTSFFGVPRLTGKTRITGKTTEIPERPKNNRGLFPVLILLALFV